MASSLRSVLFNASKTASTRGGGNFAKATGPGRLVKNLPSAPGSFLFSIGGGGGGFAERVGAPVGAAGGGTAAMAATRASRSWRSVAKEMLEASILRMGTTAPSDAK